ncbi:MAG: glycosyltransferase [Lutibacter sp.]|nr:glycosyltransferase [Lutibacter sp.]
MKELPLISIILPVYNGQNYLSKAIESCLNQSYNHIELVIVNDCSTDNSLKIIESYGANDKRIVIINNKENKKLPASLNIGHKNARGAFITWTSDDNILKPNFIEVLFKSLEKEHADVVYSNYDIIYENGSLKRKHQAGPTEHLLFGNKIGASFLYKKEVYQTLNGYDENLYLVEDYDFWLRASLKFKFFHLDENLYQYRLHQISLTANIQNNKMISEQHKKGFILMFTNISNDLGWCDLTKNLLMGIYLKSENIIPQYFLYKEIIIGDILKIKNKSLDNNQIIYGLLISLRNVLLNNKENKNFRTLINILRKEKMLLFHKTFSKKVTINYIKNCILINK